jgi:hypothetical protein
MQGGTVVRKKEPILMVPCLTLSLYPEDGDDMFLRSVVLTFIGLTIRRYVPEDRTLYCSVCSSIILACLGSRDVSVDIATERLRGRDTVRAMDSKIRALHSVKAGPEAPTSFLSNGNTRLPVHR